MSALDSSHNQGEPLFYTIRLDGAIVPKIMLHGFNLAAARVTCEARLPFKTFSSGFGPGVYGLAINPNGGTVLVLGPTGAGPAKMDFRHSLLQIDPSASPPTIKTVAALDRLIETEAASSTYDASNGIFYTLSEFSEGVNAVVGISVLTGQIAYSRTTTLYTIDFHNGLLLGFGFGVTVDPHTKEPKQIRTLATLNPTNNASAVLMNLTGYAQNLPPTALNAETGLLVALLTPQDSVAGNLVSINTTSLKVVSEPQMCVEYDQCPWTLAWEYAAGAAVAPAPQL